MRKRFLFLFLTFGLLNGFASTAVPGGTVSGTWTQSGSPYLIQGAIMIANGSTLTIEPGVKVEFQGSYKFLVLGQLLAIGTKSDSIIFTSANTSTGWLGIRFDNTTSINDSSKFYFCKFEYGKATSTGTNVNGGALYFDAFSKADISNSKITNCLASTFGGAIYCNNGSSIKIVNTTINNCTAQAGGGIYCYNNSNPLIQGNTIINNSATNNAGGGIYCYNSSSPTILNNLISSNNSSRGAGIFVISSSSTISNNTIIYNTATNDWGGAGIYTSDGKSNEIISNNIISNNYAINTNAGGIFCASQSKIFNNVITNNSTTQSGGGIYCYSTNTSIFNNTISNNSASNGGGMAFTSVSSPILSNNIIWGNTATKGKQLYIDDEESDPSISYCDVQGGQSGIGLNSNIFYLGTYANNIDSDPLFLSPSEGSGNTGNGITADWSIQTNSPCVNAGDLNGNYPTTDIVGNPRVIGDQIDMGAFESQTVTSIYTMNKSDEILFYPNPTTEEIVVNMPGFTEVEISTVEGSIIMTGVIADSKAIDLRSLPNGIYIIKAKSSKETVTNKLIKK